MWLLGGEYRERRPVGFSVCGRSRACRSGPVVLGKPVVAFASRVYRPEYAPGVHYGLLPLSARAI